MNKKLGKLPAKIDKRTLKLATFLDFKKLPQLPDKIVWSEKVNQWPMMKNDEVGDCAIAGLGHIVESWSANESSEIILSDDQIVDAYSAICGYEKGNEQTDNGCILLDVLNYWRRNGVHGHQIEGYVSINPQDIREVQMANYLFGAVYLGLNLPLAAQNNQEWTIPFKNPGLELAGSWGGHCVMLVDSYKDYSNIVSWGQLMKMDWEFLKKYCDEAYAVFSPEDWAADGTAPNGFDVVELRKCLKYL